MSDILLEENVLEVIDHDNIESVSSLTTRNGILLSCLERKPEKLHLFVYALMQSKKERILEIIKNPQKYEELKTGKKFHNSMYFIKVLFCFSTRS